MRIGRDRRRQTGEALADVRIRTLSSIDGLAGSWDRLAAGSGSPMQHHGWVAACAGVFAPNAPLRVVFVEDAQGPLAIAPLIERGGTPLRLELLGPAEAHEPMDLIYRDEAGAIALAEAMLELRLPLLLARVPAESVMITALRGAWRGRGIIVLRPALGCPSLALGEAWTGTEPPLKAGRRSDLRRARRRAEELGQVRHEVLCPGAEELDKLLDDMFRVEAAGWKARAGTALAVDPVARKFYRRYAAYACQTGILRLCFLWIGDQIAAVQLAVESADRFWLLKIGYDERFARCSPGMLLVAETVRDAARRGLRSYEFLGMAEPWIRVWTEDVRPHVSVHAYPFGARGSAALTGDMLHAGWRRVANIVERRR